MPNDSDYIDAMVKESKAVLRRVRATKLVAVLEEVAKFGVDEASPVGQFLTALAVVTEDDQENFVRALAAIRRHSPSGIITISELIRKLRQEAQG